MSPAPPRAAPRRAARHAAEPRSATLARSYLTGISTLPDGLLKLDIAAVYLVSTLAVTATGAIVLAASEEFVQLRSQRRKGPDGRLVVSAASSAGATEAGLLGAGEPSLWDLGLFIFDNASPGAAAAIERLRHQTLERLGQQSQDMAQEHAAAESASRPAESSRR